MNLPRAILLKLLSAFLFAMMSALVRYVSQNAPVGQVVFYRSAFAIPAVLIIYAWRRELWSTVRTARPFGHFIRGSISIFGMFSNFAALARLPIVETTAIGFAAPFVTVALAAIFLKERVRIFRWSAVGVGFVGVIVMLWPHLHVGELVAAGFGTTTVGAILALCSACASAASVIQTRRLTDTETTSSIVFYFSLFCATGSLLTLPFGWHSPSTMEFLALALTGILGGVSHVVLTESFRYAPASVIAPFDYTAMIWAFVLGYVFFGELPTVYVFIGAAIVAAAGLFVIWRERQLGLADKRARDAAPPAAP